MLLMPLLLQDVFIKCPQTQHGHVFPPRVNGLRIHQAHDDAEVAMLEVAAQARAR